MINDYVNTQLSSIGDIMAGCQSEAVRRLHINLIIKTEKVGGGLK